MFTSETARTLVRAVVPLTPERPLLNLVAEEKRMRIGSGAGETPNGQVVHTIRYQP